MDTQNKLNAPVAIIIAGILIAGAVLYSGKNNNQAGNNPPPEPSYALDKVRAVDNTDHLRGAANPEITVVEYSDLECPFCKVFHETMHTALAEYSGKIAWVYRHFPIDRHPLAYKQAEATECVAQLGGTEKYWQYVDKIFEVTPSNNGLDMSLLPKMASELGIDEARFTECLDSGKQTARIRADIDNALEIGAQGTPFSVVIFKNGKKAMIPGALPLSELKKILDKNL
ncbi:MAG: DsbA family protein [Patescibacteria group bacterium]